MSTSDNYSQKKQQTEPAEKFSEVKILSYLSNSNDTFLHASNIWFKSGYGCGHRAARHWGSHDSDLIEVHYPPAYTTHCPTSVYVDFMNRKVLTPL